MNNSSIKVENRTRKRKRQVLNRVNAVIIFPSVLITNTKRYGWARGGKSTQNTFNGPLVLEPVVRTKNRGLPRGLLEQ